MSLHSLQHAISAFIQNDQYVEDEALLPSQRSILKIHQRHYWYSYQKALATNYPLIHAWVGDDWPILVRAYFDKHPWNHHSLQGLGEGLPEFLKYSQIEQRFRFIADVAHFERMRQRAQISALVIITDLLMPDNADPTKLYVRLNLNCEVRLFNYCVLSVWSLFHEEALLDAPEQGSVAVFCHRDAGGVVQYQVDEALFYFWDDLKKHSLLEAVERQLQKNDQFDTSAALSQLNQLGAIEAIIDGTLERISQ